MKITIDLEDLINEFIENADNGEYGIEDQFELKKEIKNSIISQVGYRNFSNEVKDMREKAESLFKIQIKSQIEDIVKKQVERIILKDKFKFNSYDKEEITLVEYVKKYYIDRVSSAHNNGINMDNIVKVIAKEQAEQLKERYDLLFASQLVSNLDKLGLLKEDAAKILLNTPNKEG